MHDQSLDPRLFTVVFSVLAVLSLVWLVSDRRRPVLMVGDLLHLAMAVAMVAMVWIVPAAGLAIGQLVVFGGGAVWFGVLAVLRGTGRVRRRAVGAHGPWQLVAHAVMMLAMVWMVVVMGNTSVGAAGQGHGVLSTGATVAGVAATAALVVAAVLLVVELVECLRTARSWRRHAGELAGSVAMSLGMAAMCWEMLG